MAANPAAKVSGEEELAGKINYLIGKDPSKWRTGVATYAKVRYEQVYPGIDLVYYGNQRQLEYDFVVGPGADPARIRLKLAGAQKMFVDGEGQLVVQTAGGGVRWNKPEIYQEVDGQHRSVQGKYVLRAGHELGFSVASYDTARPLIIDPTLVYSTYLGAAITMAASALRWTPPATPTSQEPRFRPTFPRPPGPSRRPLVVPSIPLRPL